MATTRTAPRAAPYGDLVRQYLELRDEHPGVILLFRVGSFYEVLFEDAELVARELGLKLGQRPSGGSAPPVPQCGFAHHALDSFLPRLLSHGYRVAVCEEGEAEAESGGVRERAVVRTLTPGTLTDPRLLREDRPSYLVALAGGDGRFGLAWTDVAAGEFKAGEFDLESAAAELQRLEPAELLVPAGGAFPKSLVDRRTVTPAPPGVDAVAILKRAFPQAALHDLPLAQQAAGLALAYLERTRGDDVPPLDTPQLASAADGVRLDAATQRHLELVETELTREASGSLLAVLDRTTTPMGRRMLRAWLLRPLTSLSKIVVRQRIVGELVEQPSLRSALEQHLAAMTDLERLAGRAAAHRASVDDLRALAGVARQLPALARTVAAARTPFIRALANRRPALAGFATHAASILPAEDEAEGEVSAQASPRLAEARQRMEGAARWQARYVEQLRRQPGLGKVKLERTTTQGLFLEVPLNTPVPSDWVRRGGLQKVERYTTPALEEHAVELAEAEALVAAETKALLAELRAAAAGAAGEARDLARHLAAIDVLLAFATVAAERRWVRPEVDEGHELRIVAGRHPVLETLGPVQPNDAHLVAGGASDQLVVLTGPNLAGKSTWMRQVALICLLAQVGSYVPAREARIGLVDAIYTRIGAVDDLAGGRSTFMVEMLETAAVLNGVTPRSLVLLDELGRGTSTHDGMAIAWAVIEHLATGEIRPRVIVATHYHELAALRDVHEQITLLRAVVEERPTGIVFTHRIEPGAADRSFGIEVARLAGLPPSVLERAQQVADAVEPLSAEIAAQLSTVGRRRRRARGVSAA
ncbi:MAG TPA: DNA mismatch repair protein MutS [Chloroflexota bacterium]|nr:DNA mismatch repair protein MutS [Chloroflexota bacterium]